MAIALICLKDFPAAAFDGLRDSHQQFVSTLIRELGECPRSNSRPAGLFGHCCFRALLGKVGHVFCNNTMLSRLMRTGDAGPCFPLSARGIFFPSTSSVSWLAPFSRPPANSPPSPSTRLITSLAAKSPSMRNTPHPTPPALRLGHSCCVP